MESDGPNKDTDCVPNQARDPRDALPGRLDDSASTLKTTGQTDDAKQRAWKDRRDLAERARLALKRVQQSRNGAQSTRTIAHWSNQDSQCVIEHCNALTRQLNSVRCLRCRQKKVKCSGNEPCTACVDLSLHCVFEEAERKVLVSEKYLQHLVNQVDRHATTPSGAQTSMSAYGLTQSPHTSVSPHAPPAAASTSAPRLPTSVPLGGNLDDSIAPTRNPLTFPDSFFSIDSSSRQRYLGSSSTLAFSWHVRSFLHSVIGNHVPFNLVPDSEEQTYTMASESVRNAIGLRSDPTAFQLPPLQRTKYLAETAYFHLGELYHVFDRDRFMAQVDDFYQSGSHQRPLHSIWHAQLLLVIAFGKLFLQRGASALGPPGATDFLRAIQLQSDDLDVGQDPVTKIEVLCMISLYLNTLDMRASAYYYIGRALRIALSLGMHREQSGIDLDGHEYIRRRRAWWTIYIIDKMLSVIVGTPTSIRDEDIDISKPEVGDGGTALNLHIRLATLEGKVMSAAYRLDETIDKRFVDGIQNVFTSMLDVAGDFQGDFSINLQRPNGVARTTATLYILYYQCIIISARPIILVLLKQSLDPLHVVVKTFSESLMTLIKTCVGSAVGILSILSKLQQDDLLEPFFTPDLQSVFSASFVLLTISIACPTIIVDESYAARSDDILCWMSEQGNVPAKSRRRDLAEMRAAAAHVRSLRERPLTEIAPTVDETSWLWDPLGTDGRGSNAIAQSSTGIAFSDDDTFWRDILNEIVE